MATRSTPARGVAQQRLWGIVAAAMDLALSFGALDGATTGSTMMVRVEVTATPVGSVAT